MIIGNLLNLWNAFGRPICVKKCIVASATNLASILLNKAVRDFVAAWNKVMNLDRFDLA